MKKGGAPFILDATHGVPKPRSAALIDEDLCIGCTLCIQACPVDAIVGAAKQMHTVIAAECTGCELCVAPCPMDCIHMIPLPENIGNWKWKKKRRDVARSATNSTSSAWSGTRQERLEKLARKTAEVKSAGPDPRKAAIQAAVERTQAQKAAIQPKTWTICHRKDREIAQNRGATEENPRPGEKQDRELMSPPPSRFHESGKVLPDLPNACGKPSPIPPPSWNTACL